MLLFLLPHTTDNNTLPKFEACTVHMHAGIRFFQQVKVVDPDDPNKLYLFDLEDPQHCACFNIGKLLQYTCSMVV